MRIVLQSDEGELFDVVGGMTRDIIREWVELLDRRETRKDAT
jgi:hypothetical protein